MMTVSLSGAKPCGSCGERRISSTSPLLPSMAGRLSHTARPSACVCTLRAHTPAAGSQLTEGVRRRVPPPVAR